LLALHPLKKRAETVSLSDRDNKRLGGASLHLAHAGYGSRIHERRKRSNGDSLIAAGISVAIIAVVNGLGTKLKTTFSSVSSQLK
jgi:hypothetical protein